MRRLLALLLASTLAAASAHAGEPACDDAVPAAEAVAHDGEPASDDCGDCGEGCLDCTCCRAPLAVQVRAARPTPPLVRAKVGSERAALEGVRPPSEIFQPPRA